MSSRPSRVVTAATAFVLLIGLATAPTPAAAAPFVGADLVLDGSAFSTASDQWTIDGTAIWSNVSYEWAEYEVDLTAGLWQVGIDATNEGALSPDPWWYPQYELTVSLGSLGTENLYVRASDSEVHHGFMEFHVPSDGTYTARFTWLNDQAENPLPGGFEWDANIRIERVFFDQVHDIAPAQWITNSANGHAYALTEHWSTFEEAEAQAVAWGGHLVTINDQAEQDWLYETFGSWSHLIGLNDIDVEGTFVWASGEPVGYTNWCLGEPNNVDLIEDVVHMVRGAQCWNDVSNDGGSAIVELDAAPTATIDVSLSNDWVSGGGFLPGGTADVDVNGAGSSVGIDGEGRFFFNPGPDLVAGDSITVTDGATTKALTLAELSFDSLDPDTDVGSGTANVPDGTELDVSTEGPHVTTTVTGGVWSVDFATEAGVDVLARSYGVATLYDPDGDGTVAEGETPRFDVSLSNDWVSGGGFLPGGTADVDVNGAGSSVGIDGEGRFFFNPGPDLVAGDSITVTDGATTKALTLAELSFDSLDPDTDVGSGTANVPDGTELDVSTEGPHVTTTVTGGVWSVDFATEAGVDVLARSYGVATLYDPDGDGTVAEGETPRFDVSLSNDWVSGGGFLPGGTADVDVNGAGSSVGIDGEGRFFFNPGPDLVAGDSITVTDGATTKALTLAELSFDSLDPDTDVGSGTANVPDGTELDVSTEGPHVTTTVTGGVWSVDFATEAGVDVLVRSYGVATLYDPDGDGTVAEGETPRFDVSLSNDWVSGGGFLPGGTADVDVNGAGSSVGIDGEGRFFFNPGPDLVAGDSITVTDGATTKALTLAELSFDSLDPDTDVGSGTANVPDGTELDVSTEGPHVTTTVTGGVWSVDFATEAGVDVVPGSYGSVALSDDDGDQTVAEASAIVLLHPTFTVFMSDDFGSTQDIVGFDFFPSSQVTIAIDLGDDGSIDYEETATVDDSGGVRFDTGIPTVQEGDRVTLTDDLDPPRVKSHVVGFFTLAGVDDAADLVTGTGRAGTELHVRAIDPAQPFPGGSDVIVVVDGSETWTADFSGIYDIGPGTQGWVQTNDADGDHTQINWWAPLPETGTWTYNPVTGHYYALTDYDLAFSESEIQAQSWGGHLVTVDDQAEQDWLYETFGVNPFWIGMNDLDIEGNWVWVSGAAVSYTNWCEGEPNDHDLGEDAVHYGYQDPCWNDVPVDASTAGIVEVETLQSVAHIEQNLTHGHLSGNGWPIGTLVTITIDDPETPEPDDYQTQATVQGEGAETWFEVDVFAEFGSEFDLKPGLVNTVTDGTTTKVLEVANLTVTDVDAAADTIYGTAEQGVTLEVGIVAPNGYEYSALLDVIVDGGGQWIADFGGIHDLLGGDPFVVRQYDADGDVTFLNLNVELPEPRSWRYSPATGHYYARTDDELTFNEAEDMAVGFGGHLVTVDDQAEQDWLYETFGAQPWWIGFNDIATEGSFVWTSGAPVAYTNWCDGEPNDTSPGEDAAQMEHEAGDRCWNDVPLDSRIGGIVEVDSLERIVTIQASITHDNLHGNGWPAGATVTITLDDPDTPEPIDYEATADVTQWGPGPFDTGFDIDLHAASEGQFDIRAGHVFTVTDGVTTKVLEVAELTVTNADADSDTVTGTAKPGADLTVWVDALEHPAVSATADAQGDWTADFSGTHDLGPGMAGAVQHFDADGDMTEVMWEVPNPQLAANPWLDYIVAWDWPLGTTVTLTVDDDFNIGNGVLYEATASAERFEDTLYTRALFDLVGAFDLQASHVITVTDGTITKDHQLTSVDLTEVDLEADTMSGVADPFTVVSIEAWTDSGGAGRRVTTDAAGIWVADFSYQPTEDDYDAGIWGSVDLQGNYNFGFYQQDDELDNTGYERPQGAPGMLAAPDLDVINIDATGLSPVALTVESAAGEVLYEETVDVVRGGQAGDLGGFDFPDHYPFINSPIGYAGARVDLSGMLDLVPGQVITWSDIAYTVEMVVSELSVIEVDVDADVALGIMGSSASGVWGALQDFAAYGFTDPVGASEWTMAFCEAEAQLAGEDCVSWDIIHDDLGLVLAYGDSGFRSYTGAVWDLAPTITELTLPTEPVEAGTPVELSATFADLEVPDTHTATVDWGDGTEVEAVDVTPGTGPGSGGTVAGSHSYAAAGSYTVGLTVAGAAGDSATATTTVDAISSTVGLWLLDDGDGSVASDGSGNGHDGTVVGALWVDGLSGGALVFDGAGDVVTVPAHDDFYPAEAVTVEAWVKLDALPEPGSGGTILLNGRGEGNTWNYHLNVTDDGRARWSIKTGTSTIVAAVSEPVLVPGRWYHLAGTYDSASLRLYVDGDPVGETAATGGLYASPRYPLTLGAYYYFSELRPGIVGSLDEVAVHVRALTGTEIADHYTTLVNEPPVAVDDEYTVLEGSTLTVAASGVLGNDSDPEGGPLTAAVVDDVDHGALTLNGDGSFTYAPHAGTVGDHAFTYLAVDDVGQISSSTVTITVEPFNAPPNAEADEYLVVRNTTLEVGAPGVLGNDTDPNLNTLMAILDTPPEHGTLSLQPDGSFTYEPETWFEGTDSFTYVAGDGELQSDPATVTLIVHRPLGVSTTVNAPSSVYVPVSGSERDYVDTVTRAYGGPPGRPTYGSVYLYRMRSDGEWRIVGSRSVSLYDGSVAYDSFRYYFSSSDLYGVNWKTEVVVAGEVIAESSSDRTYVGKDGSWDRRSWWSFRLWSPVDMLVIDPAGRRIGTTPEGDIVNEIPDATYTGPDAEPEEVNIPDPLDGEYTVILTATGTGEYHLDLVGIGDDEGEVVIEEISGTVTEGDELTYDVTLDVPAVPEASDDAYTTAEDVPLTIDAPGVLANDVDEDGDPLTAILGNGSDHGTVTLNADGSLTYAPDTDWYGTDTFAYVANDGQFDSNEATVTIEVIPVNDPPVGTVTPTEQTVQYSDAMAPITIAVDDIDSTSVTATTTGLPDGITLAGSPCAVACDLRLSGTVTGAAGTYDAVVTIDDGDGGATDVNVTIIVEPEDASITFHGGNPVAVRVEDAGGDSETFDLMVRVREAEPDVAADTPWPGEIGRAEVAMRLIPVGPGSAADPVGTCERRLDGDGYDQELTVTCTFDEVAVNAYTLAVTVDGDYTGAAEDVVVVYDPSLGYTTGGGSFLWPETDEVVNFGYTMEYNKKGKKVKGNLLFIRHLADGSIYRVKSNALYGLALGEGGGLGWASFSGKATYLEPGMSDPEGNHEFIVYVEDRNEPGEGIDRFWIEMRDKQNVVITALSMDRDAVDHAVSLTVGDLVVPHRAAKMK